MFRKIARRTAAFTTVAGVIGGVSYGFLNKHHKKGMISPNTVYHKTEIPSRDVMVNRLKDEMFDVLIIGGGATGAGVALDAASRGLKCAVVEADDFASGTSSRSTKLIHGGVRYLESAFKNLDPEPFWLVVEALEERSHLMKVAPHMSRPVPIVTPVYSYWELPYFWVGIKLYDLIAKLVCVFDTGLPECYLASKANSKFLFPLLNEKRGLTGSIVYYDGQHNDSRMNLSLIMTAAADGWVDRQRGAAIANHVEVSNLNKDSNGQICGATVKDTLTKDVFTIRASSIINCTGPFADQIRKMGDKDCEPLVTPAAGVHLVLPSSYAPGIAGMIIPETSDGRVLFALPWEGNTIVGTTDGKSELSREPKATQEEVEFIIREAARYWNVSEEDIRSDVKAAWTGLRPLCRDVSKMNKYNKKSLKEISEEIKTEKEGALAVGLEDEKTVDATKSLSRTHQIVVEDNGLISVLGGKWTTYRRMAQDAIDTLISTHGEKFADLNGEKKRLDSCRTKNMLLVGSVSFEDSVSSADLSSVGGSAPRLLLKSFPELKSLEVAQHLTSNYGSNAWAVCRSSSATANGFDRIIVDQPFINGEINYVVKKEMACSVADVLGRRLRVGFVDSVGAENVVDQVVDLLKANFGWSAERAHEEKLIGLRYLRSLGMPSQ